MAPGACERNSAHTPATAAVVNDPKAQPAEGNTSIYTARACGQLDSKQYSSSAEPAVPFLETGSPSTPCGLHAATRTIAPRVASPHVVCYEASDMAHYLLRKFHHVRSFEDTAHKKILQFSQHLSRTPRHPRQNDTLPVANRVAFSAIPGTSVVMHGGPVAACVANRASGAPAPVRSLHGAAGSVALRVNRL